jgi:hypothetical protein
MAIVPFNARPSALEPDGERRRARLVLALATLGIAASLLAYAISPTIRHAVGHAAHSVKHAVGHVLDRDARAHPRAHARAHSSHKHQAAPRSSTPVRAGTRLHVAHAPAPHASG